MRVVFRVDASLQIGTGHVMRCLTLANALRGQGAVCTFICREHPGHLIDYIRTQGHAVHALALRDRGEQGQQPSGYLPHSSWLGATQEQDIEACRPILECLQPEWLVVDHYALDINWEKALKNCCRRVMVIDDLADRYHECDLLLDQNLGRKAEDYQGLVPAKCIALVGPEYALLRPEFAALREYSLARRQRPQLKHLLITMGGVDVQNGTGQVLDALRLSNLPTDCRITVVMGKSAPYLAAVKAQSRLMPWSTHICVDINNMAQRMADSDICIGAAGSTSWERCCLGLPTIMAVLADNQRLVAQAIIEKHAAVLLAMRTVHNELPNLLDRIVKPKVMQSMIQNAYAIADGAGSERVCGILLKEHRAVSANLDMQSSLSD